MLSKIKAAGTAAAIGFAIAGGVSLFGAGVANAEPASTLNCGLSQGLLYWAYTNCGSVAQLVQFHHQQLQGTSWDEIRCVGAGQVITVGPASENISAYPVQGPCIPAKL
ncbi:hypothetical protein [Amycolatopsis sp. NPDC003676]